MGKYQTTEQEHDSRAGLSAEIATSPCSFPLSGGFLSYNRRKYTVEPTGGAVEMDEWTLLVLALIAILVYLDAQRLHAAIPPGTELKGMAESSPAAWGFATFLIFIIALPLYLIARPKLVAAAKAQPAPAAFKRCAMCDRIYDPSYDSCPHCAKA